MAQLVELRGVVTYSTNYCGGAAPTEEIVSEMNAKKPYANIWLYIRRGEKNNIRSKIVAKVKTDSLGKFSVKLRQGTYSIVDSRKKNSRFINSLIKMVKQPKAGYKLTDKSCLLNWLQTPDVVVRLTTDTFKCELHYVMQCSWNKYPCMHYLGQYPP